MWLGNIPWAGRRWHCPSSPCWRPRNGITSGGVVPTRSSPTGPARWFCNSAAGCRTVRWCWWGTAATPSLDLLHFCQSLREPVTLIARLRLDAGLYAPAPPRHTGQMGRPRVKGPRLPKLKQLLDLPTLPWAPAPVAWYDGSTRTMELASQTAVWYHCGKPPRTHPLGADPGPQGRTGYPGSPLHGPRRWLRRRLWNGLCCAGNWRSPSRRCGLTWEWKPQRQWSDRAIARTTPVLMGLFSWITLAAHLLQKQRPMAQRTAAWYAKPAPTFIDAIALVRRHLWLASESFSMSAPQLDSEKSPHGILRPPYRLAGLRRLNVQSPA